MRVAIIRRVPQATFSMDVYASELIKGLSLVRPDWEIVEISPTPWWTGDGEIWQSGSGLKKYYERFWRHPRSCAGIDADIFHIIDHTDGHIGYWLKQQGKPYVVTCHDLVQFVYPEILRDQARLPALSLAIWKYSVNGMRQANRVVTVSDNTKRDVIAYLGLAAEKVDVVYNAVDPLFRKLPSAQRQIVRSHYRLIHEICLLNVGSTHQRKNIPTVLTVLKMLRDRRLSVCLWRAGGSFTRKQQQYVDAHRLGDAIFDLGKPDQTELINLYNAADLLLAPSLYEGFGLTILEAMACGLPVITSNVSALPEVVADAAIMVDPLDADGMVKSVIKLTSDRNLAASLAERGLQRAEPFTWRRTAEQVAQTYECVLNS